MYARAHHILDSQHPYNCVACRVFEKLNAQVRGVRQGVAAQECFSEDLPNVQVEVREVLVPGSGVVQHLQLCPRLWGDDFGLYTGGLVEVAATLHWKAC